GNSAVRGCPGPCGRRSGNPGRSPRPRGTGRPVSVRPGAGRGRGGAAGRPRRGAGGAGGRGAGRGGAAVAGRPRGGAPGGGGGGEGRRWRRGRGRGRPPREELPDVGDGEQQAEQQTERDEDAQEPRRIVLRRGTGRLLRATDAQHPADGVIALRQLALVAPAD